MLACVTTVTVAAGAECLYLALDGQPWLSLYAGIFLVLGLLSGFMLWEV